MIESLRLSSYEVFAFVLRMSVRLCLFGMMGLPAVSAEGSPTDKPNIVYILADDQGYGDARCYNPDSPLPTPGIDRLAREGMRFTDAHSASSVCTPTRYALLTGRYAWRTRLQRGVLSGKGGKGDPPLIAKDTLTVGEFLQSQGYRTSAIGKWHLGFEYEFPEGMKPTIRKELGGTRSVPAGTTLIGGP
ncbi:MAG: sulfatase-like hydrolase/transferase, partial [Phycisphaeraceae bacterium]